MSTSRPVSYLDKYCALARKIIFLKAHDLEQGQKLRQYIERIEQRLENESNREAIAKQAYIDLLFLCNDCSKDSTNNPEKGSALRIFKQNIENILLNRELITNDEFLFVTLYDRAKSCIDLAVLEKIKGDWISSSFFITIQQANREIALALYAKLPHLLDKNRLAVEQLITAYIVETQGDLPEQWVSSINDYKKILYKDYVPAFMDAVSDVYGALDAEIKKTQDAVNDFCKALKTKIKTTKDCEKWATAKQKQEEVKTFVHEIKQFDHKVRQLQAQLIFIQDDRDYDDQDNVTMQRLQLRQEIMNAHVFIQAEAARLKDKMHQVFVGIPSTPRGRALSIGLMILGVGLMIAGVAAMIVPPVGVVSLAAGAGMTAIGVGGVTFAGGGFSFLFFKHNHGKEARKRTGAMINYVEAQGIAAHKDVIEKIAKPT